MYAGGINPHLNASSGSSGGNGGAKSGNPAADRSNSVYSSSAAEANDISALVFEYGTAKCKLGYAGDDFPTVYESPLEPGEDKDRSREAAQMEMEPERVAQWLFDATNSRLQTRLSDHPLLLVERPFIYPEEVFSNVQDNETQDETKKQGGSSAAVSKKRQQKQRERMVETLMEELGVPALFCANSAVLSCYANAHTSGIVVELGATYSSVTTVHEGFAVPHPKTTVKLFGGHDLDELLRTKLSVQKQANTADIATDPAKEVNKRMQLWSVATEAKESGLCRVADSAFDEAQNAQLPKINYELPDKTIVSLGTERFSVAEQYFSPPTTDIRAGSAQDHAAGQKSTSGISIPELVCETGGQTMDAELRRELFQNVVLTGGSSCFDNLPTRLEREVVGTLSSHQLPMTSAGGTGGGSVSYGGNLRVKVVAAHAQYRKVGSFVGGSILGSLGSFHEMWMSKAEYAEHGASLVHKKCP